MLFNRPPRIQKYNTQEKIIIPSPENLPTKPTINWFMIGLPILGIGAAIGLSIWLSSDGMGYGLSYLFFLPLTFASVLASVVTYWSQNKEYKRKIEEIRTSYREMLRNKRVELQDISKKHLDNLIYQDPGLSECAIFAEEANTRLGERRPHDKDFLQVRIGLGETPSDIDFEIPTDVNHESEIFDLIELANNLKNEYSNYRGAPITVDLKRLGSIGIAGEIKQARAIAQSLIIKICSLHWLEEVQIGVFLGYGAEEEWNYIDQLPHRVKLFPSGVNQVRIHKPEKDVRLKKLEVEIRRRKKLLANRSKVSSVNNVAKKPILPVIVSIFDNLPPEFGHSAVGNILQGSPELGVYGIFLSEDFANIPSKCKAIIKVVHKHISLQETGEEKTSFDGIVPDDPDQIDIIKFASNLSKINWILASDLTNPPKNVSLLELFEINSIQSIPISQWWDNRYPKNSGLGYLKALIGKFSPTDNFILDFNDADETIDAHGPHGFIGGATGSGKSELLRTLVLSLALTHHPYDLNFALIDYKGGAAFEELDQLPHVVGVITNIDKNQGYASRVVESLIGEMKTREKILKDAYATIGIRRAHIKDYRDLPIKRPLPRLLIIFDEFAEFKDKHPDEADDLISIARKGRALGIHLILATQSPMFAVTPQVQNNARFRICLSVNSQDVSRSIIDIPDAYDLSPGRGYFKVSSPQLFQTAYTGKKGDEKVSEAQEILSVIENYCEEIDLADPPDVWPSPLEKKIFLPDILSDNNILPAWSHGEWREQPNREVVNLLGYYDYPTKQVQPIFSFGGKGSSHLLIVGSSESGKSTTLLTVACSLAYLNTPKQAQIYGIDFSSQKRLRILKDFPHVAENGGIVSIGDKESIAGLFSLMYWKISSHHSNNIYFLIDSYNLNIDDRIPGFTDQLLFILEHGPAVGIHIILTANLIQDVHYKIREMIMDVIALRQTKEDQYDQVLDKRVPKHLLFTQIGEIKRPGWGLINTEPVMELQVALPAKAENKNEIDDSIELLSGQMLESWDGERPDDIIVLPKQVFILDLMDVHANYFDNFGQNSILELPIGVCRPSSSNSSSVLVDEKGLELITVSIDQDGPIFTVASTESKKGKTSCLLSWLLGLEKRYEKDLVRFDIIDFHNKQFGKIINRSHIDEFITSNDKFENYLMETINDIENKKEELDSRYEESPETFDENEFLKTIGFNIILIDDYYLLKKSLENEYLIDDLIEVIEKGEQVGYRLIISEKMSMLKSMISDPILYLASGIGSGILLGGSEGIDFFNEASIPFDQKTSNLDPGRGYFINKGNVIMFQSAAYWPEDGNPEDFPLP